MIPPTSKCLRKNNLHIHIYVYVHRERGAEKGNGTKYKPLVNLVKQYIMAKELQHLKLGRL